MPHLTPSHPTHSRAQTHTCVSLFYIHSLKGTFGMRPNEVRMFGPPSSPLHHFRRPLRFKALRGMCASVRQCFGMWCRMEAAPFSPPFVFHRTCCLLGRDCATAVCELRKTYASRFLTSCTRSEGGGRRGEGVCEEARGKSMTSAFFLSA